MMRSDGIGNHSGTNMDIVVNGEHQEIEEGLSVEGLLTQLEISPNYLVVEQNYQIVPSDAFGSTILHAGDRLEVISFIGGG